MTEKEFKTLKTRAEYRRFAVWASWRIPKFKYGLISHATPERPRNANIVFEKKFADELRLGTLAAPGIAALLLAASPASYGESLSDKAQRESETMAEQIKQGDNDKERWARVSLYSDSEEPEDLALTVIKNAGLAMKLDPLRGQLEFTSKGNRQAFTIATARDDKRTTCPKYNVRVIDASAKHAVLRRVCNE